MAERKKDPEKKTRKRKPGAGNPALTGKALNLEPGDNTKYLTVAMTIMKWPKIDLWNPEEVAERIDRYYSFMGESDSKPTVSGLAMALGLNRQKLWKIVTDGWGPNDTGSQGGLRSIPNSVKNLIKKAYEIQQNLWEDYMQNGKINPVSGIFLGKNHFGYQDKVEHVVQTGPERLSYSADEIRERYAIANHTDPDPGNLLEMDPVDVSCDE